MTGRVRLLVNPASGGGRGAAVLPAVTDALQVAGRDVDVVRTSSLDHAEQAARDAAIEGETVVALGGDGLVGRVAGAVAETDGLLGVLPGGRGNDFARALGIPRDTGGAVAVVLGGHERRVDVAEANGRAYVGIGSAGFDSEANRIANETTIVRGQLVYAYGALRALLAWHPARFELELDGTTQHVVGYSVAVANSPYYGGGMRMAPGARLDDGVLDVIVGLDAPKWRFLAALPKVFSGRHVDTPLVRVLSAREVRLSADRPFTLYADGEPLTDLPANIRLRPRALRVLAPPAGPVPV